MRKFTVFTVILTLIVVVVAAQVVANQYWPEVKIAQDTKSPLPTELNTNKDLNANVLGADTSVVQETKQPDPVVVPTPSTTQPTIPVPQTGTLDPSTLPPTEFGDGLNTPSGASDISGNATSLPIPSDTTPLPSADLSGNPSDFESSTFKPAVLNVYLNQDQLKSAGFTNATLDTEAFDGFLYKNIYIQDLKDLKVFKNVIKSTDSILCKVYIIDVGPMNTPKDVYDTLMTRGAEGLDVEINETNSFGDGSFFMNDSRRQNVAFLTVRFGNLIYGFSYPKEYHPQVQNLIKLLDMEF